MDERAYISMELMKALAKRNKPFATKHEKTSFCVEFYNRMKMKRKHNSKTSKYVARLFEAFENGQRPAWITTTTQHERFKKMMSIYKNFKQVSVDTTQWKLALLELFKKYPSLMNTRYRQSPKYKQFMLDHITKFGYTGNATRFQEERKTIIRGIRAYNGLRWAQKPAERALFNEVKEMLRKIDEANANNVFDDGKTTEVQYLNQGMELEEIEKGSIVELSMDLIESSTDLSNDQSRSGTFTASVIQTVEKKTYGKKTLAEKNEKVPQQELEMKKRISVDLGDDENYGRNETDSETVQVASTLSDARIPQKSGIVVRSSTRLADTAGYQPALSPEPKQDSQATCSGVQKWEHVEEPLPQEGIYEELFEKFGEMRGQTFYWDGEQYSIDMCIGYGAFSVVHKGTRNGEPVALKFSAKDDLAEFTELLKNTKNPFLALPYKTVPFGEEFLSIMPLMSCDLFQLTVTHHVVLSNYQLLLLTSQMSSALSTIQNCGYFHADVKPENILLKGVEIVKTNEKKTLVRLHALLSDFNSSHRMSYNDASKMRGQIQSSNYRAPEVIAKAPCNSNIDTWSLGMVILQLLFDNKFVYEDYKGSEEAAKFLIRLSYEVNHIPKELLKKGCPKIYRKFKSFMVTYNFTGLSLKELMDTLPHTGVNVNLKFIIEKCMDTNPHTRMSISDLYNYVGDYAQLL